MNKLTITTFATTFALAIGFAATVSATNSNTTTNANNTTASTANAQNMANAAPAAGTKHHHHHLHRAAEVAPVETPVGYTEMRIGDPRIVYHEIGTAGAQRGNTIVPFFDEPIRSEKPYEIRYDYAEFKAAEPAPVQHKRWSW